MNYIVFDLEFNQDILSLKDYYKNKSLYPFEIIQIGAIKLDCNFKTIAMFNRFVKPTIYSNITTFVTKLTGITTEQLQDEKIFPEVLKDYLEFIGEEDAIFCIWGMSDIKELYRNAQFHHINTKMIPSKFINLQPFVSIHLGLSKKDLLGLSYAIRLLNIPITAQFHDAFNDAYYTAELFKEIYNPFISESHYDPTYITVKPRPPKRVVDFDQLMKQFEKMYRRDLTDEEQDMIKLAYKMGKTGQFTNLI